MILHNMTVENEEGSHLEGDFEYKQLPCTQASLSTNEKRNLDFYAFLLYYQGIWDIQLHNQLKSDLIENLWKHIGKEYD